MKTSEDQVKNVKTDEFMTYRLIALSFGLLVMTLSVSTARAQRNGGFTVVPAGRPAGLIGAPAGAPVEAHVGKTVSRGGPMSPVRGHVVHTHRGRRILAGSALGPNYYPHYYPYYYPDYDPSDYDDGSVEPPPARMIAQAAPPDSPAPSRQNVQRSPESIVMELRGDHWVRLTSYGPAEPGAPVKITGQSPNPQSAPQSQRGGAGVAPAIPPAAPNQTQAPPVLPTAVLVFRDGHQEEAAKYTIVGATIFIKADYWSSGSWTRKIPIAELDLAATLKLNQERGAKFSLPSRPGEVMMRP